MFESNYPEELKIARRRLERLNLRLQMYEHQAVNGDPEEFDHWCDLADETKVEIERQAGEVFLADLNWRREHIRNM